jgi:transcription antitermination factor NusG
MSAQWYVLHCKPHKEACVAGRLGFNQINFFYPTIQVQPVNPRSQKVKPFFPGYLFVHLEPGSIASVILKWMPGTVGLVSFYGVPATVPDNLIMAIRQRIQLLNPCIQMLNSSGSISARFKPGEAVRVVEGPLAGVRGIFDLNLSGSQRVRVLLKMLGLQNTRVVLPAGVIEAIKQP